MSRFRLVGIVVAVALALAGCGSSSPGSNPLNAELSYFPATAPFVMSVVTDPNSSAITQLQQLIGRFPVAGFGESALMARLQQLGIDYQNDIRPLFGNPIVFGLGGTGTPTGFAAGARSQFVAVWMTKDEGKLKALLKKLFPAAQSTGTRDGATIFTDAGLTYAVSGPTLLVSASPDGMNAALDRHAHGGGISSSAYTRAFSGLPQGALIQAYGNLTSLLSTSTTAGARRVPWVAALRGYATTVSANSTGLTFRYRLDTTGRALTDAQLPIAPGTTPPGLTSQLPIAAGMSNPAHFVSFIEAVEQTTSPGKYGSFLRRQAALRRKTGADVNSLLSLLTGDLNIASDTHTTMARAGVSNASAASATLAKLAKDPRDTFSTATGVIRATDGFYIIKEPKRNLAIGVTGNQLVVGNATPAQLTAFASAPTTPAAGAQGTVAFRVGLPQLLAIALRKTPSQAAQAVLRVLGDLTGSLSASTSALNGIATLGFK